MENFCLYNGKKIAKLETWDITSVELSSDYTSAIIQAESKRNKSEHTLDITPLINNQYADGLDPYVSTIVNELTGVSDWVLDSANNQIKYTKQGSIDGYIYANSHTLPQSIITSFSHEDYCRKQIAYGNSVNGWNYIYYSSKGGSSPQCLYRTPSSGDPRNMSMHAYPNNDPTEEKTLSLNIVTSQVISNAEGGDSSAQQAIVSTFNNITDDILTSDYSEFFEQNKQPK